MFSEAPVISLFSFRPHPFPVKGYRYLHNIGTSLPVHCGFVLAVFNLFECRFEGGCGGFEGMVFYGKKKSGKIGIEGFKTISS